MYVKRLHRVLVERGYKHDGHAMTIDQFQHIEARQLWHLHIQE